MIRGIVLGRYVWQSNQTELREFQESPEWCILSKMIQSLVMHEGSTKNKDPNSVQLYGQWTVSKIRLFAINSGLLRRLFVSKQYFNRSNPVLICCCTCPVVGKLTTRQWLLQEITHPFCLRHANGDLFGKAHIPWSNRPIGKQIRIVNLQLFINLQRLRKIASLPWFTKFISVTIITNRLQ